MAADGKTKQGIPSEDTALALALSEVAGHQQGSVGGKSANLARMIRARLPVPPGFCVTTAAFDQFLNSCSKQDELSRLLARLSAERLSDAAHWSQQAADFLAETPMPLPVEAAVLTAWRTLGEERIYAVRSSATVEDAPGHSFAGQFESFLNVRGQDALMAAIRRCWLSLFSERALAYQLKNGLPTDKAAMAVIVQEMVPADAAGVLFTEDPVSESARRMVIEATAGLGEQLVSGKVNPERLVLDGKTLRVIEHTSPNGPGHLDKKSARRLGELGQKVERLFGGPQDIEWAVAGGHVFLLQARPITTTRPAKSWGDRQVWSNINAGEVAPDVMSPIMWSLIQLFIAELARPLFRLLGADGDRAPGVGLIAGRIYFNANTGLAAVKPIAGLLWAIPNAPQALGGARLPVRHDGRPDIRDEDLPDLGFRWPKYVLSWPRILYDLITHSPRRGDAWTVGLKAHWDALAKLELDGRSAVELARSFDHLLRGGFKGWDLLYLVEQAAALPWFQWACHKWLDDPNLTLGYRLFAALGGLPEAEAALALWRLASLAHGDPATEAVLLAGEPWATARVQLDRADHGRQFLKSWQAFMAEHGHHCRGELELFNPRWSETPDYILGLVRGYLLSIGHTDPIENQRRLAAEREQLTGQCRQRLRNPIKRWIFTRALSRAQKLAVNREEWKNQCVRQIACLRQILLRLGEQLKLEGIVTAVDDVFFLEIAELAPVAARQAQFDVKAVISQRRLEYEKNLTLTPPPVVVGRFDATIHRPPAADANATVLRGIPVFPGVVTGPARVILRADDHEQVLPGEILVAPFTDPAWTPYFLPAAGVVMDLGGILSHGSIVAREYGLPAVTNVGSATHIIRTGDLVQVDGDSGRVTILSRATPKRRSGCQDVEEAHAVPGTLALGSVGSVYRPVNMHGRAAPLGGGCP